MEENKIYDFNDCINILKKGKWFIVAITLLAALAGVIQNYKQAQTYYIASTTMVVSKNTESTNAVVQANDIILYQNLIKTYADIAESETVAEKASEKLKGAVSANTIRGSYAVLTGLNTQLIKISVSTSNPQQAFDIAKAVFQAFTEEASRIYPFTNIKVVDEPKLPTEAISTSSKKKVFLAVIIGILASVLILFAVDYLNTTIRTEKDAERYLGIPVIANISNRTEEIKRSRNISRGGKNVSAGD